MKRTTLSLLASTAVLGFSLNVQSLAAETIAPVALPEAYEGTAPAVLPSTWVLVPSVDAEGKAILNADGTPAMSMVDITATDDGEETHPVVPGNTVIYEFAVANPTDAPLDNINLTSAFPANLALDAASFSGPEGMLVAFSTSEKPDTWFQIYPAPPEADRGEMPSLDAIANLRVTVPQVPVDTQALVSYAAVVRQGTTATTNPTLESE